MASEPAAVRYRRHAAKKQEKGFVRRSYWIPKAKETEVKNFISKLAQEITA